MFGARPVRVVRGGTAKRSCCRVRPFPNRCKDCPASAWPSADSNPDVMRQFVSDSRCPHDHPGGSVDWVTGAPVGYIAKPGDPEHNVPLADVLTHPKFNRPADQ
jgi:hypothetical protein